MADNNDQQAAGSLPPVSNKYNTRIEKVSSSLSPPAPDNNNNKTSTATWVVLLWAILNAISFTAMGVAIFVLNLHPCTKSTWIFPCVTLSDAADTKVTFLRCGERLCSAVAALGVAAHVHAAAALTRRTTTTTTSRGRWPAAVHAVACWVALAGTVGVHCMYVASRHIILAADPGRNTVHVAFGYACLAVDLVAGGVLLCCSPRRRLEQLGEHHQGGNDDGN